MCRLREFWLVWRDPWCLAWRIAGEVGQAKPHWIVGRLRAGRGHATLAARPVRHLRSLGCL